METSKQEALAIIRDIKSWDCDPERGLLSLPLELRQRMQAALESTQPAEQSSAHWSASNPGLADQYRAEAMTARIALGFAESAENVSPADIRGAIATLKQRADSAVPDVTGVAEDVDPLPFWEPCNPGCDPEFNGVRSRYCADICDAARTALAAPTAPTAPAVQGEPVAWLAGEVCGGDASHNTVNVALDNPAPWSALPMGARVAIRPLQPAEQQPAPDVAVPTPEMIEAGANAVMITDSASECAEKVYRAMRAAAPQPAPGSFDFLAHLRRQREWSERTFGPGQSTARIIDHITKELREVAAAPDDVTEWIDVAILALDGAWRCGASPEQIQAALVAKHKKNEARQWPDWRTMPADKAIEHSHTGEASTACCGDPGDCWEPCGDLGKSEAHVRVSDHSPDDWVPISERLPELNQPVVLININGFENVGGDWERHIQDAGYLAAWGDGRECKYWSVRGARAIELSSYTHWLPLPAAPVTDGEGQ